MTKTPFSGAVPRPAIESNGLRKAHQIRLWTKIDQQNVFDECECLTLPCQVGTLINLRTIGSGSGQQVRGWVGLREPFCHRCDRVHTFVAWVWSPDQCWWIWLWTAFWTVCLAKTAESLSQGIVGVAWICSSGYHQFSHRRLATIFTDGSHFVGLDHWDQRDHLHSLSVASSQSSCCHSYYTYTYVYIYMQTIVVEQQTNWRAWPWNCLGFFPLSLDTNCLNWLKKALTCKLSLL